MSTSLPEEMFSYDGWLVFNGLFSVTVDDEDQTPEDLVSRLSQYAEPDPGQEARGFERAEFDDYLQSAGDLTWSLQRLGDRLYTFNYKHTRWNTQSGYAEDDDSRQTIRTKKEDGIEIHWDNREDLVVFRGQKADLARNRKRLRGGLSEQAELEELNFHHDFLLWVLYQKFNGQGLNSDLSIREVTTVGTTSESIDNTGQGVKVEGSKNVLRSVPAITAILDQKKPEELECKFVLDNQVVKAKVEHGGKVHVKVTDNELEELSDLRRMAVSLQFIFELIHQYDVWRKLPSTEKFPPESFFYDLAERAEDEGYEYTGQLRRVPEEYKRKRQGQPVDDDTRESGRDAS